MAKTNNTFEAKYERAQLLLNYISSFPEYQPPRQWESITDVSNLLNAIAEVNAKEAELRKRYSELAALRQKAFRTAPDSLQKTVTLVLNAVKAQYGNKSHEYNTINAIAKTTRAIHRKEGEEKITELSYNSLIEAFKSMISEIEKFPVLYNPTVEQVTIEELTKKLNYLIELHTEVENVLQKLNEVKAQRQELYNGKNGLSERVKRIKSYIKVQYGVNSPEYAAIKSIKV
ncbi:MAG: hypothetical protein NZ519_01130 [Bacteroidia bacterium]|nr:hypothetical protein [Bacteroidia bacterium]MDW8301174.1 hypothetical protein [Bacteroidia bacterium]